MSRTTTREVPTASFNANIRIRAPLRCEGVGTLEAAEDISTGSRLAIRWFPIEAKGEAAIAAIEQLPTHSCLPAILQTGKIGDRVFAAIDFPEGKFLAQMLGQPMGHDRVAHLGATMAEVLAVVHEKGFVHCDLSADSILLMGDNRAMLWDVPLVVGDRRTDRRDEYRILSRLPKTASFMSPERARGDRPATPGDVYSLGVALCYALGAEQPLGNSLKRINRIANDGWRPTLPESTPSALADILERVLAPNPNERPTAMELSRALAEYCVRVAPIELILSPPRASATSETSEAAQTLSFEVGRGETLGSNEASFEHLTLSDLPPYRSDDSLDATEGAAEPVEFVLASKQLTWDVPTGETPRRDSILDFQLPPTQTSPRIAVPPTKVAPTPPQGVSAVSPTFVPQEAPPPEESHRKAIFRNRIILGALGGLIVLSTAFLVVQNRMADNEGAEDTPIDEAPVVPQKRAKAPVFDLGEPSPQPSSPGVKPGETKPQSPTGPQKGKAKASPPKATPPRGGKASKTNKPASKAAAAKATAPPKPMETSELKSLPAELKSAPTPPAPTRNKKTAAFNDEPGEPE